MTPLTQEAVKLAADTDRMLRRHHRLIRYGIPGLNVKVDAAREALRAVIEEVNRIAGHGAAPLPEIYHTGPREVLSHKTRGRGRGAYKIPGKNKWRSRAVYKGHAIHLGTFDSHEAATREYRKFWMSPTAWLDEAEARALRRIQFRKTKDDAAFRGEPVFRP